MLLAGTVALASLLPAYGIGATIANASADIGIVVLFFLHGARLSRKAIIDGARKWRLHASTGAMTFIVFPVLGLGLATLPFLDPWMARGLLFLSLLPSTVQSSIAFTAMAGGNVPAAICSASFSNLAGIALTPLLVTLLMAGQGSGIAGGSTFAIIGKMLVPFIAGHLLRPLIGKWVDNHQRMLSFVDRGSILMVVYAAFSAAVVEGLWSLISTRDLTLLVILCSILLVIVLTATYITGRWLRFDRADTVVLQFCGSKKSLATGVPMAGALFARADVGLLILPLMFFHQIQLMVCAVLAQRYGRMAKKEERSAPAC